ncbi:stage III sporulation protein AF [Paenibacillus arenosi]|uniref:Stage III sporulation protein AF n=1 Tax=Paenibacillus arenosi TaxID=2774142 RepID=A0ABR9AUF0_9BACL|nr:stage III sporulation protein AF [Paenibacillus arenosi]MBD8497739.1 stage III sporulation protein AF [Paenibacillus arenosi]
MSWLSEWLKEIIMLILLAAFVDLLLPSAKMQRYVKLMLSLIILLALLSPIMKLFDNDLAEQVAVEWEQSNPTTSAFASLTSIQRDAARLQHQRQMKVSELAESQLESQMTKQLNELAVGSNAERLEETETLQAAETAETAETASKVMPSTDYGVQTEQVNVKLGVSANEPEPTIQSITVSMTYSRLAGSPSPQHNEQTEGVMSVQQVRAVDVRTESIDERASSAPSGQRTSVEQHVVKMWEKKITDMLTSHWLVKPEEIHIEWKKI